jgi:excisionase family DNA binding protein
MGISLRTFQRLVKDKVEAGYQKKHKIGKTGQPALDFDAATIDQWKNERKEELDTRVAQIEDLSHSDQPPISTMARRPPVQLQQLMQILSDAGNTRAHVPIESKLLLTRREAQALTGLSRDQIVEAIHTGQLKAFRMGRADRIKRDDLNTYIKRL